MVDLGIIFLRRKHTIHWYQSLFIVITGSMPFRYFWATLYTSMYAGAVPHNTLAGTMDGGKGQCIVQLFTNNGYMYVPPNLI